MTARYLSRCALLVALISTYLPTQAQQEAGPAATPGTITLDVVVAANDGRPVAGLEQKDFTVLDNKAAQSVASFQALGGDKVPVQVILVVDAVNLNFSNVASERDQVDKFLRANGGQLAYPTRIAFFTEKGLEMMPQASRDGSGLSTAFDSYNTSLRTLRRSTGIYGADERLQLSLGAVHQLAQLLEKEPGRKLILWISPGWPFLTGPNVTELTTKQEQQLFSTIIALSGELREGRMTLYALDSLGSEESISRTSYYRSFLKGVTKPNNASLGNVSLQVLATQTGGLVLNSNDLTALLTRAVKDLDAYYEISFSPKPGDKPNEYHQITVQVARPGFAARTLQGYYSQP